MRLLGQTGHLLVRRQAARRGFVLLCIKVASIHAVLTL